MNLDDKSVVERVDSQDMLGFIDTLPDQLHDAWQHAASLKLDKSLAEVQNIVICGMGGSAISGDLIAALVADRCPVPIFVNRHYDLPTFVSGPATLVIALSHSGNTEETLSAVQQGLDRGAKVMAITTGGKIKELVESGGGTVWQYEYVSQPRAALGWLYGMILGAFHTLGLADLADGVAESIDIMKRQRETYRFDSPVASNAAKRMAGQCVGKQPVIWGSGLLEPVARRWKTQINENSKTPCYYEGMPELNHNTVVGTVVPEDILGKTMIIQLKSAQYDHSRVKVRQQVSQEIVLQQGIGHDAARASGTTRLAQQMSLIQFGDYISYYLSIANEIDATPIPQIDLLKSRLAEV